MKNICLFEVDAVDADRFYVEPLTLTDDEVKLILIDDPSEYEKYLKTGRLRDCPVICTAWCCIGKLSELLIKYRIEVLLIDSHRVVDLPIISAARRAQITISYTQHGIYVPFMKRSVGFFVTKLFKTLRYLYYAIIVSVNEKDLGLLTNLIRIHVFGGDRSYLTKYGKFFPDQSVVFSPYWADWHCEFYKFPNSNILPVGATDFRKFEFGEVFDDSYFCYCYQTLVEDGRINKGLMLTFYDELDTWRRNRKMSVVVKWHPRGSPKFQHYLVSLGWLIMEDKIPNTKAVVGHYSSLLAYWGIHGRSVVTVDLPGHEVIESFRSWTHTPKSISEIKFNLHSNTDKCRYYFGSLVSVESIRTHLKLT